LRADRQVRCFSQETLTAFERGQQRDFGPELAALVAALRKAGAKARPSKTKLVGSWVFPDGRGVEGVVDVTVFNHDASALTAAGEVFSWGNPERGTVGQPPDTKGFLPPTRIEGVVGAVALVGSFLHRCVLDGAGRVWCFGEGSAGRLGSDQARNATRAIPVEGLPRIVHLASNEHCTFAIAEDHTLYAWGMSWVNACGLPEYADRPTERPTPVLLRPAPPPG
jgi:alpha-tubulin suppressor-like RCC1 family protein